MCGSRSRSSARSRLAWPRCLLGYLGTWCTNQHVIFPRAPRTCSATSILSVILARRSWASGPRKWRCGCVLRVMRTTTNVHRPTLFGERCFWTCRLSHRHRMLKSTTSASIHAASIGSSRLLVQGQTGPSLRWRSTQAMRRDLIAQCIGVINSFVVCRALRKTHASACGCATRQTRAGSRSGDTRTCVQP